MKCASKFLLLLSGVMLFAGKTFAGYYATPALPVINTNNIVNVLNFGALGDNLTTNTVAISNAIVKAASGGVTNGAAGGTVEIPAPGAYLCGPINLLSSVNLQVDPGAILRMLPLSAYPGGTNTGTTFISASSLHDVELSGGGAIDGQGAAWWPFPSAPRAIMFGPNSCNRLLISNITLSNSPMFHIAVGGHAGNTTVSGVTVFASGSSPNTDACDVSGTNVLVENCNISEGDDDYTCGGGTSGVLLTNNTYGTGHGISIGSYTDSGGVSNITMINCTMNGTLNGIRIKSDDGRGGLVHNIQYINIGMTNVDFPIQIYSYYLEIGTPNSISPLYAATQAVAAVTSTTPIYRDITFSNITATSVSGYPVGILWGRTEMPETNITFYNLKVTGDRNFELYNVQNAQFINSTINVSANTNSFALFDSSIIVSNTAPSNTLFSINGITTNGYGNSFTFYNTKASIVNTNVLDAGPVTLSATTLLISNNLALPNSALSYTLSTNTTQIAVKGNLSLGGTNYITAGSGFTNGTYTLMTYTGTLTGTTPVLGSVPPGYNYAINTSTAGQVNLVVTLLAPTNLIATASNLLNNLTWNSVTGANTYTLSRGTVSGGPYPTTVSGLTGINYADANVTNLNTYYYVVSATGAGGTSSNSVQARAAPLPSNVATNIVMQSGTGQLQLSWPQDHQGWRLEIQTNDLNTGISGNWFTVANSTNEDSAIIPVDPANGTVFLRLVYP